MLVLELHFGISDKTHNCCIINQDVTSMCSTSYSLSYTLLHNLCSKIFTPTLRAESMPTLQPSHHLENRRDKKFRYNKHTLDCYNHLHPLHKNLCYCFTLISTTIFFLLYKHNKDHIFLHITQCHSQMMGEPWNIFHILRYR